VWSLGIILYILICGYPPFHGETDKEILQNVRKGEFVFEGEEWDVVSSDVKNLIHQCLNLNPDSRPTVEQILDHPWFSTSTSKDKISITGGKDFINK